MRTARSRRRSTRRPPLWLCSLCLYGCSGSDPTPGTSASNGSGNLVEAELPAIHPAAHDTRTRHPIDATPSPDGTRVYFLASSVDDSGEEQAGVFSVAADGGEITPLASGEPLLAPVGISSSLDGAQLFVADAASGADATGGLFALPVGGGALAALSGTEGYRPAGLTVARHDDQERIYFSGRDPQTGAAGLFSTATSGGAPESVVSGDAFSQPGGVAVAASGDAYVADVTEAGARVLRVRGSQVEPVVENIGLGFPAGVTLTRDDATLVVSGLDPTTKHDVVYFVALGSGEITRMTNTVGAFTESAGLHRAHDTDVFAWADSQADITGTVYVLGK